MNLTELKMIAGNARRDAMSGDMTRANASLQVSVLCEALASIALLLCQVGIAKVEPEVEAIPAENGKPAVAGKDAFLVLYHRNGDMSEESDAAILAQVNRNVDEADEALRLAAEAGKPVVQPSLGASVTSPETVNTAMDTLAAMTGNSDALSLDALKANPITPAGSPGVTIG